MRSRDWPTSPERIVVRGTNWVGDTVMSLPAAKELRRTFPGAGIVFWVHRGLADLVMAAKVADAVITFDDTAGGPWQRPFRMRGPLSAGRFDAAVLFQNAFESAFTAWLAGIAVRVGYPTDLRGPLLSVRVPLTRAIRQKHQVFYYLGITHFIAAGLSEEKNEAPHGPDCSVTLNGMHRERAAQLLDAHGIDQAEPIFCLCPGSVNSEAKRWPGDSFAALADLLSQRLKGRIVFLGAPGERHLVESIIALMRTRNAVNLAGEANVLTSMAVMGLSRLVISNDTGSAHLAVAASADVLTLFGPTSAGATAPYGPRAHLLQGEAPCAPCRHFRCPSPEHRCMRSIRPEDVLKKAQDIVRV